MKNLTRRNVSILAPHPKNGGMPFRVLVIAGSTLTLEDSEYEKVAEPTLALVNAGVIEFVELPESKLTKEEIIDRVSKEAGVDLKDSMSKKDLQENARKLGVSLM